MGIFSKKESLKNGEQEVIKTTKKITGFQKSVIIYLLINLGILSTFLIVSAKYSKKIKADVQAVVDRRKSQADANLLTEYVAKLEKDNNRVVNDFDPYLELLPMKDDLLDFKADLVNTAKKYKLDPAFSFGVENPATAQEPRSYGFTLIISGTTTNLFSFWEDFAKMKYILRIEQILIDQEDGKTKTQMTQLGSGNLSTTTTTTGSSGSLTLDEELELLAKNRTTTTKKKKSTTTTTKLINTYKMNVLGKIYIR